MLETVPGIVADALAAGAAAGANDTAKQAVVDAYQRLKSLVSRRYRSVDLKSVEQRPGAVAHRRALTQSLQDLGANDDLDLLSAAQELVAILRAHEATVGAAVGVDLERVQAAALRIGNVESSGAGVRVTDGTFLGEIDIGQVRAGDERGDPPPAHR